MFDVQASDPAHLARRTDPETSHQAARSLETQFVTDLQEAILAHLTGGAMPDEAIEQLAEFGALKPSTLRTRRAELVALGLVRAVGQVKNSTGRWVTLWGVTEGAQWRRKQQ